MLMAISGKIHDIRAKMVSALKVAFPDYDLTYSIGGKISFDVFPRGWDKTYALNHIDIEGDGFEEVGTRYLFLHSENSRSV